MGTFILKNFWLLAICVNIGNGLVLKVRSIKYINQDPTLKDGYKKYFWNFIFYSSIPWAIVGIGNLTRITTYTFQYFNPQSLNPFVLLFHLSIIILWIYAFLWIFKKEGAEFIEQHPGLFNDIGIGKMQSELNAQKIKGLFILMSFGSLVALIMMWSGFFSQFEAYMQ